MSGGKNYFMKQEDSQEIRLYRQDEWADGTPRQVYLCSFSDPSRANMIHYSLNKGGISEDELLAILDKEEAQVNPGEDNAVRG